MACTSKYVYSGCATPTANNNCYLYTDKQQSQTVGAGNFKVKVGSVWKRFQTDATGLIISENTCQWSSTQYYSALFTGTKNDCVGGSCSVYGSTVNLNDGNPVNSYVTSGSATSYVSQADADAQAYSIAYNLFEANKQARVNQLGYCTWTYNSGSGSYNANFTRNNCASNCYGTTVNYGNSQSGYSGQSTVSCQDAINVANNAAYQAAVSVVNANGQNYANSNGGCCCWNLEYYCDGCNRRSRERDSCTNATRNDTLVASNSCACGNTCNGTYWNYYCSGSTRYRELKYNCDNSYAGTTETYQTCSPDCGTNTAPTYTSQGYTTCYSCNNATVYKDTNPCSSTYNGYYVFTNNYYYVGNQPTGGGCNYSSVCVDSGSAYCSNGSYVINQVQSNPCSGSSCGVRVINNQSNSSNPCWTAPSCTLYELYMYSGMTEYVNVTYTVCGGGTSTMSAYNDGGGGYGGQVCAVDGTAYISSGSGALINQGSCT